MTVRQITVHHPQGLHFQLAEKASKIAHTPATRSFIGYYGNPQANAFAPLQLLMLGATAGTALEIAADGPEEESVIEALTELFENGGGI